MVEATLVIVIATIAVVLWPLFRSRPALAAGRHWERDRLESLLSRRDSAYDAIRDLDFEYRLGNLSEEDYTELRNRYREQAARLLRRLDLVSGREPGAQQQLQPALQSVGEEQPQAILVGELVLESGQVAPSGNGKAKAVSAVCPHCGEPVSREREHCPSCGELIEVSDAN